ncbi:alcohol dehydrogenase catalytic domain-containing protein [Streptomyces sp. NPDC008139]|uniref:alcohol dehydrogenase catalytic domain-containing protein n=1 Tax=Streptomyces sp. NPDC008139 TaxID=3364814 RepID=UPI0036F0D11D
MKALVYNGPYEGRTTVERGKILGHENMGIVEDSGPAVTRIKPGDRVSVPFNIACGSCRNDPSGQEHPEPVLDHLVKAVRTTGGIGVVGVYISGIV